MRLLLLALLSTLIALGCDDETSPTAPRTIVLYTSVDEPYVRPIIERFTQRTGIKVHLQTDTEATKSIGLAERLRSEKANPRADVWWGNEVFHTVQLADEGAFAPYESPAAKDVRSQYRDAQNRWTGVAVRARVMAVAPAAANKVSGLSDLLDPAYKGKVCLARPTAGTTSGHVAALYVSLGNEKADRFFKSLAENGAVMVGGNSDVTRQVAAGNFSIGLTDNDDITATNAASRSVSPRLAQVIPGQSASDIIDGTLAIPTTVALVRRSDVHEDAKKLIDYLLSSEVERELISVGFAGWSVRDGETTFRAMKVDYAAVARAMPNAVHRAVALLEKR